VAGLMFYSIFAWAVASVFIAVPLLAFISFVYVIAASQHATRGARAITKRDRQDRNFDARHGGEISEHTRPSQRWLLKTLLNSSPHNFLERSQDLYTFTSEGVEVSIALSPGVGGFTVMKLNSTLFSKVGLTTRLKNHQIQGLLPNQQIAIANERFNFGDVVLTELAYLDHMSQSEFAALLTGFMESAKACSEHMPVDNPRAALNFGA
jgi:hypothetical protein